MLKAIKNLLYPQAKKVSVSPAVPLPKHRIPTSSLPPLGMTTKAERDYLLSYAQTTYQGVGDIVDLGSWMGSLTIPLLEGLAKNTTPQAKKKALHAYDIFTWSDWMEPYYNAKYFDHRISPAETFLPDFARQVIPYDIDRRLVIHAGDLCLSGWSGRPIEMLVVDVMKSFELSNCVLRDFYTHLIPGVSQVFHQDFIHYYTPWIHLTHYRLRDFFEPIAELDNSCTLVFRLKNKIPSELLTTAYSFADFTDEEVDAAFAYSSSLVTQKSAWVAPEMAAVHVMAYFHQGKLAQANALLRKAIDSGVPLTHGLLQAQELIIAENAKA